MTFKIKLIFLFVCSLIINVGDRIITIQNSLTLICRSSIKFKHDIVKFLSDIKKNIAHGLLKRKFFSFWRPKKKNNSQC